MCHILSSMRHIFRTEYSFLIYIYRKKREKKIWIQTIILAIQNLMNKKMLIVLIDNSSIT